MHSTQDAIATNVSRRAAIPSWPRFCLLVLVFSFWFCVFVLVLVLVLLFVWCFAYEVWESSLDCVQIVIAFFWASSTLTDMHRNLPIQFPASTNFLNDLARRPDGSVGVALGLPALTDCRWWFESLLVHSEVWSATRRKATGANTKKKINDLAKATKALDGKKAGRWTYHLHAVQWYFPNKLIMQPSFTPRRRKFKSGWTVTSSYDFINHAAVDAGDSEGPLWMPKTTRKCLRMHFRHLRNTKFWKATRLANTQWVCGTLWGARGFLPFPSLLGKFQVAGRSYRLACAPMWHSWYCPVQRIGRSFLLSLRLPCLFPNFNSLLWLSLPDGHT